MNANKFARTALHQGSLVFATAALALTVPALAAENFVPDAPKAAPGVSAASLSLANAITQVATAGKLATQAKYEFEDGKLWLSVYTSEKGKGADAEHNVLQETKGEYAGDKWVSPKTETFKDTEHVARSAEFHALMSLTNVSLADIAKKAEAEGKVIWVQPMVKNGKAVFDVGVAKGNQVAQLSYDLMTGNKM